MMRAKNPFMRKFIGVLMKVIKENLIVTKNISQLIFDGYDDKLLNIAKKFNSTLLPFDKFGWFYGVSNFLYLINIFNQFLSENR